jgi:hypothetical protein
MQDEQHRQDRSGYLPQSGAGGHQQPGGGIPPPDQLPYQARVRKSRPANQGQDGQWEPPARNEPSRYGNTENPPGVLAVEDKINRFAESKLFCYLPRHMLITSCWTNVQLVPRTS